jgi:hypothetical protein
MPISVPKEVRHKSSMWNLWTHGSLCWVDFAFGGPASHWGSSPLAVYLAAKAVVLHSDAMNHRADRNPGLLRGGHTFVENLPRLSAPPSCHRPTRLYADLGSPYLWAACMPRDSLYSLHLCSSRQCWRRCNWCCACPPCTLWDRSHRYWTLDIQTTARSQVRWCLYAPWDFSHAGCLLPNPLRCSMSHIVM